MIAATNTPDSRHRLGAIRFRAQVVAQENYLKYLELMSHSYQQLDQEDQMDARHSALRRRWAAQDAAFILHGGRYSAVVCRREP